MLAEARVGTSGFAYREWVGQVYPPEATSEQLLPLYAQRLSSVEVSLLPPERVESWAAAVPPRFQFAVKAPTRVASELTSGRAGAGARCIACSGPTAAVWWWVAPCGFRRCCGPSRSSGRRRC